MSLRGSETLLETVSLGCSLVSNCILLCNVEERKLMLSFSQHNFNEHAVYVYTVQEVWIYIIHVHQSAFSRNPPRIMINKTRTVLCPSNYSKQVIF